jgi:hypothetical protein
MSRYSIRLDEQTTFVYGYDNPLMEYFFQYINAEGDVIKAGAGTQSTLLNAFDEVGIELIPESHVNDVALDMPIGEEYNRWVR